MSKTVQGFTLIDVDVVALNNAGKEASRSMKENITSTKKIRKNNREHAYVSGQAWRYWWRETLKQNFDWEMSPIIKVDSKNQTYTEANPVKYPDDDMFGYMRAPKKEKKSKDKDEEDNKEADTDIKNDSVVTRISPLKNSALISVSPTKIVQNQSSMNRHEGNPVLFEKDEYCAVMKGMFSISLEQVGTFSSQYRTGFKNLNEKMIDEARKNNCQEIDDPFAKNKEGKPLKLYRLPKHIREKRITETIEALEVITGGAMQTCNMGDVTPKLIVLCTLDSGNHLFSHLAKDEREKPVFSVEALKQVVEDYKDRIQGKVYIGRRMGFMDELEEKLSEYQKQPGNKIYYGSVNEAIREYVKEVKTQIP
jgi:CRISPR-associated protein Cst2